MDMHRLGAVCRALRIRKGWRQVDLAQRADVSASTVSRLERGEVGRLGVDDLLKIVEALGGQADVIVRWRGGELDRLLNARHSALHESVARDFVAFAVGSSPRSLFRDPRGTRRDRHPGLACGNADAAGDRAED